MEPPKNLLRVHFDNRGPAATTPNTVYTEDMTPDTARSQTEGGEGREKAARQAGRHKERLQVELDDVKDCIMFSG